MSQRQGPLECRAINPITDIPDGRRSHDSSPIGQHPRIRRQPLVAGSVAIAKDYRVRGYTQQFFQLLEANVHGTRLIDEDDTSPRTLPLAKAPLQWVGQKALRVAQSRARCGGPKSSRLGSTWRRIHVAGGANDEGRKLTRRRTTSPWLQTPTKAPQLVTGLWRRGVHGRGNQSRQRYRDTGVTFRHALTRQDC